MTSPRFSVVIITYNQRRFVIEAIDSLRQSSFQDWEAICVDDGSTDGTAEIVQQFAAADARISAHVITHSGKPGVARNAALPLLSGEYVCFLDGDDLIHPRRLELLDAAITHVNGNVDVLFHDYADFVDGTSQDSGQSRLTRPDVRARLDGFSTTCFELSGNVTACELRASEFAPYLVAGAFIVHTSTVCIRREHFVTRVSRFPADRVVGEDNIVWLRCITDARILVVNATLSYWRKYPGSLTATRSSSKQRQLVGSMRELQAMLAIGPTSPWFHDVDQRVFEESVEIGLLLEHEGRTVQAIWSYFHTAFEFRRLNPVVRAAKAPLRAMRHPGAQRQGPMGKTP